MCHVIKKQWPNRDDDSQLNRQLAGLRNLSTVARPSSFAKKYLIIGFELHNKWQIRRPKEPKLIGDSGNKYRNAEISRMEV
jgi:hypothetical protein